MACRATVNRKPIGGRACSKDINTSSQESSSCQSYINNNGYSSKRNVAIIGPDLFSSNGPISYHLQAKMPFELAI